MSLFPPYDRRSTRRAAQPAVVAAAPDAPAPAVGLPAATPAAAAVPSAVVHICANCDTERAGEYCAHCGQHFLEDRLSFRVLASELWERVTFERGWLRTFREMMLDPGGVARRYVEGQRRRYVSPLTYLFLGAALSLLMFQLYDEQMVAWMRAQGAGLQYDDHPFFTPRQLELHTRLMTDLVQQTTYTGLFLCASFAVALRLVFRRSGVNLVETFVLALFTFGHVYYIASPLTALTMGVLGDIKLSMWTTFPLYILFGCVAAAQYFGRPVRSAIKALLALGVSYFVFSFLLSTSLMVYVLLSIREGISAAPTG